MLNPAPQHAASGDAPSCEMTVDGTAYRASGHGDPLILVHGVGLCKDVWEPQIAAFQDTHQVIAYDMFGHGGSRLAAADAGLEHFVAQLADLLDALQIESAHIAGHSMGALVALGFALAHPHRVRRLAAINAVYDRSPEQRASVLERAAEIERVGPQSAASRAIARWFGDEPDAAAIPAVERVRTWLRDADPVGYAKAYRIFATGDHAHVGRLPTLSMPVLYLTGDLDPNSTPEMSRRMASETPKGRAMSLPDERHMMCLVSAEKVNPVLREFFR